MRKENAKGLFMQIIVKNVICIFTIKNGEIYIVIKDNKIPCITCDNDIDMVNSNYIKLLDINNLDLNQTYTFSEKKDNILTFYILFNDIINYKDINNDLDLLPLEEVKDDKFIVKGIEYLKNNIVIDKNLNKILNDEFVLPELQKILEKVLDKKFDRRNFRKKLLSQNIIEMVDKTNNSEFGRPANLYKFRKIDGKKII